MSTVSPLSTTMAFEELRLGAHVCRLPAHTALAVAAMACAGSLALVLLLWGLANQYGHLGDWRLEFAVRDTGFAKVSAGYEVADASTDCYLLLQAEDLSLNGGTLTAARILVLSDSQEAGTYIEIPLDASLCSGGFIVELSDVYSLDGALRAMEAISDTLGMGFSACVVSTCDITAYSSVFSDWPTAFSREDNQAAAPGFLSTVRTNLLAGGLATLMEDVYRAEAQGAARIDLSDYYCDDGAGGRSLDASGLLTFCGYLRPCAEY